MTDIVGCDYIYLTNAFIEVTDNIMLQFYTVAMEIRAGSIVVKGSLLEILAAPKPHLLFCETNI